MAGGLSFVTDRYKILRCKGTYRDVRNWGGVETRSYVVRCTGTGDLALCRLESPSGGSLLVIKAKGTFIEAWKTYES